MEGGPGDPSGLVASSPFAPLNDCPNYDGDGDGFGDGDGDGDGFCDGDGDGDGMSTCCYPEGSSPTENSLQRCSCLSELISFIVLIIIFTTCIIIFIMIFAIIIMITTFRMIISSSALMALEDFFRSCAEFGLLVGTAARALSPFFARSKSYF